MAKIYIQVIRILWTVSLSKGKEHKSAVQAVWGEGSFQNDDFGEDVKDTADKPFLRGYPGKERGGGIPDLAPGNPEEIGVAVKPCLQLSPCCRARRSWP
ncbi:hypothetical protein CEXT_210171 [Caerostris extrusa]|uniref:Uncharacterized protein n=1 Tax=Caerostris extrusa TaxID=172846 RepID=A0AAV4X7B6_CAEEX|nr:hypothetical protein CEXT_210171 [Caerostris extrusa]